MSQQLLFSFAAALELGRGCNGARPELPWSFVGAVDTALKLGRGCNGARPELSWSFVGAVDVALELRQGFNETRPELRWSFIEPVSAALELRRGCNEAWPERRCCVEAPPALQGSVAGATKLQPWGASHRAAGSILLYGYQGKSIG
ncbi:hypothetical protein ZWY2020_050537 [Hordeum vulgare]|nr:hypothetical protein ZWY2020_050537 [Hordeum vulgare]